ncbi:MAG: hypothetical protein ACUVRH_03765 [Candidatus Bipolaricaulia bacterium]
MKKNLAIAAAVLALAVSVGSLSIEASSQGSALARSATVLFPGEAGFPEREQEFKERTGLTPGAGLAAELAKGIPIGEIRSSTGLVGIIFKEALNLPALALGQVTHLIYGTISIPEGALLRERAFFGSYGIVVYGTPTVIVLVEQKTGELAAFVLAPTTLFLPSTAVMDLLFQLIVFPRPAVPLTVPGSFFGFQLSLNCEKLPSQKEVDLPVGSGGTIIELAGTFVVKEAGLGSLAVSSLGPALLALVTAPNYLYLNLISEKKEAEVAAPVGPEFTLLVQAGVAHQEEKAACLEAVYVKAPDGGYRLQGKVYHTD